MKGTDPLLTNKSCSILLEKQPGKIRHFSKKADTGLLNINLVLIKICISDSWVLPALWKTHESLYTDNDYANLQWRRVENIMQWYFCSFWFIQVIVMGGIALGKFYWANCIGELYWMTVLGVLYWADCVTRVTSSKLHTKWYWLNYSSELCQLEYRNNITIKREIFLKLRKVYKSRKTP